MSLIQMILVGFYTVMVALLLALAIYIGLKKIEVLANKYARYPRIVIAGYLFISTIVFSALTYAAVRQLIVDSASWI